MLEVTCLNEEKFIFKWIIVIVLIINNGFIILIFIIFIIRGEGIIRRITYYQSLLELFWSLLKGALVQQHMAVQV